MIQRIDYRQRWERVHDEVSWCFQVEETTFVRPVCLPPTGQLPSPDSYCFITGWGHMGNRSKYTQTHTLTPNAPAAAAHLTAAENVEYVHVFYSPSGLVGSTVTQQQQLMVSCLQGLHDITQ